MQREISNLRTEIVQQENIILNKDEEEEIDYMVKELERSSKLSELKSKVSEKDKVNFLFVFFSLASL